MVAIPMLMCAGVEAAYARRQHAGRPDRAAAFAGYRAALDREACAARAHGVVTRGLRRSVPIVAAGTDRVAGGAR